MGLLLTDEFIRFMESGISLSAASRDKRCLPSLARVLACRVECSQGTVRLLLARNQCGQLLQDCLDSERIALVLSDPPTHRTWQLKGERVEICQVEDEDRQAIARHVSDFAHTIVPLGFSLGFTSALFAHQDDDVVAIRFTPTELFDQTPGPRAGQKVGG